VTSSFGSAEETFLRRAGAKTSSLIFFYPWPGFFLGVICGLNILA
jgi:uncharacterized membrane protein YoaK (UPF0700 family)